MNYVFQIGRPFGPVSYFAGRVSHSYLVPHFFKIIIYIYLDLERLTRQQALLLQQQQRNRDSGFQLSSAHAIKSLHSTPNNMTPMMKYDPKYDPQQLSNYSDPQLYTSHNTFPDIDIGGSGTFQSHGNNSMMEFYEHHSQFAMRNSTNQNREPIRNNPNNHLDQSQVSVPTLLTSKRLDLLSEHPEKNLSQNLFNKNSYQVKITNKSATRDPECDK